MTIRARDVLLVCALCALLGGCGFALRGSASLPAALQQTHVVTTSGSVKLAREVKRQLDVAGATLSGSAGEASSVLRIIENESGQRILSVATTGGPEEYEVFHSVRFELEVDGQRVYGPEFLTLTRDYTFNKNDVLGKRREYDALREALKKDMASLILRRLRLAPAVT